TVARRVSPLLLWRRWAPRLFRQKPRTQAIRRGRTCSLAPEPFPATSFRSLTCRTAGPCEGGAPALSPPANVSKGTDPRRLPARCPIRRIGIEIRRFFLSEKANWSFFLNDGKAGKGWPGRRRVGGIQCVARTEECR